MIDLSYKKGEISNLPNSFDTFPRAEVKKPNVVLEDKKEEKMIIAEVMPETTETVLAEPVLEELEEAPVLVEEKVQTVKKTKKKTTN